MATLKAAADAGGGRTFARVLAGRSLTEQATVDGFEETVTLTDATQAGSYTDLVTVPAGVTARQSGAGVEFLAPDGAVTAGLAGGLAHDSTPTAGNSGVATQVTSTLVNQAGSAVTVAVSIDNVWLHDPSRVFPVVIDPTFYQDTSANGSGAVDTWIEKDGTIGTAQNNLLRVGYGAWDGHAATDAQTLMKFQFDGMSPDGSHHGPVAGIHVSDAHLFLLGYNASSCTPTPVVVSGLAGPFDMTTTWNTPKPPVDTGGSEQSPPFSQTLTGTGSCTSGNGNVVPIPHLVQRWFGGFDPADDPQKPPVNPETNYGLQITSVDQFAVDWKQFGSGETGGSWSPSLTVTYDINHRPDTPVLSCDGCDTRSDPALHVVGTDPDGDVLAYQFQIYQNDGSGHLIVNRCTCDLTYGPAYAASGADVGWRVPTGLLQPGVPYEAVVTALDHYAYSPVSAPVAWTAGGVASGAPLATPPTTDLGDDDGDAGTSDDPVNVATGNFVLSEETLPFNQAWAPSLALTYNSLDKTSGPFATGWASVLSEKINVSADGTAHVTLPDARVLDFLPAGTSYVTPSDYTGTLTKTSGWTLAHGSQGVDRFDSSGALLSLDSGQGPSVSVTRDGAGRPVALVSTDGYSLTISYTSSGLVDHLTASDGRVATFGYTNGNLTSIATAQGTSAAGTKHFTYDGSGNVLAVVDADGTTVVNNAYDAASRVVRQDRPGVAAEIFSYDDAHGTTALEDTSGTTLVTYAHDAAGRLTYVGAANEFATRQYDDHGRPVLVRDPSGATTTATYTVAGLLATEQGPSGSTSYTYDSLNRLLTSTDPAGKVTSFSYTGSAVLPSTTHLPDGGVETSVISNGQVASTTDADGNTTNYTYDAHGNVLSQATGGITTVTNVYDSAGRLTSSRGGAGGSTTTVYDGAGRVVEVDRPNNDISRTTYTPAGRIATQSDGFGGVTTYSYNSAGELTSESRPGGSRSTYSYDANGQVSSSVDENNVVTNYTYDSFGQLATTRSQGKTTTISYDSNGNEIPSSAAEPGTTNTLTSTGAVATSTDALGHITSFSYDAVGNLIKTTFPDGTSTQATYDSSHHQLTATDPIGSTTKYTYTAAGELHTATDPLGRTTQYGYDALGNRTHVLTANGRTWATQYDANGNASQTTSPTGLTTQTTFDTADNPVQATDSAGRKTLYTYTAGGVPATVTAPGSGTTHYTYNSAGLLSGASDPDGNTTTYAYDALGRTVSRTDPKGKATTFTYTSTGSLANTTDPLGRVTKRSYDASDRLIALTSPTGQVTAYTYDAVGNMLSRKNPDGATISWSYDSMGRRVSMSDVTGTSTYGYDLDGKTTRITQASGKQFQMTYDLGGQLTKLHFPDGTVETYSYNLDGQVSSVSDGAGHSVTFSRDADGRELSATSTLGAVRTFNYLNGELSAYTEKLGSTPTVTTTFARNSAGLISSQALGTVNTGYSYDAAGQLTGIAPSNGTAVNYTYDPDGNRATRVSGAQTDSYVYDSANELTSITRNGGEYGSFGYDLSGRLTSETLNTGRAMTITYGPGGLPSKVDRTAPEGHQVATIAYDGDRNPVAVSTAVTRAGSTATVTGSAAIQWLALGGAPAVETLSTTTGGQTTANDFLYGQGRDLVSTTASGATSAVWSDLSRDGLGSSLPTATTAALTAGSGYDSWGLDQVWPSLPSVPVNFGYRGSLTVADLPLLGDRTYDPLFGRFTSTDPMDPVPGDDASITPYPYANNDPIDRLDPTGDRSTNTTTLQVGTDGGPAGPARSGGGCPARTNSDNSFTFQTKCFNSGVMLYARERVPPTCIQNGSPCMGASGQSFQPEYTAQSHAIRKISKLLNQTWLSPEVDWEVHTDGTNVGPRADITASDPSTSLLQVYEVKNFLNRDLAISQLAIYVDQFNRGLNTSHITVPAESGNQLRHIGWAISYHAAIYYNESPIAAATKSTGAEDVSGYVKGAKYWAWADPVAYGVILFTDVEKNVPEKERATANKHSSDDDIAGKFFSVPDARPGFNLPVFGPPGSGGNGDDPEPIPIIVCVIVPEYCLAA